MTESIRAGVFHASRAQSAYRACLAMAWGLSLGVLVIAFMAIVFHTGNVWPWFEIVHESGDRTLLGTIFFFEHAARELPLDIVLGMAVGSSALFGLPLRRTAGSSTKDRRWILAAGLGVASALIIGGTLLKGGGSLLGENLLQYPTRPGAPPEWGGHWRYHLLSHVMLITVSLGVGAVLAVLMRGPAANGDKRGLRLFNRTFALFAVVTIVFAPNLDPFVDPVVIGHQLRESLTHAIVTIPMAFGVCLLLARGEPHAHDGDSPVRGALVVGAIGVLVGLFLLVSGLARSVASQGQSESLVVLLFPHFFEHIFSYVIGALTAGVVFESVRVRRPS